MKNTTIVYGDVAQAETTEQEYEVIYTRVLVSKITKRVRAMDRHEALVKADRGDIIAESEYDVSNDIDTETPTVKLAT